MLKDNLLENTNFLNSYLTEKDFSFISSLDKDIQELDNQLNQFQKVRYSIVLFINNLSEYRLDKSDSNITNFTNLVNNTETAFGYINDNIKLLLLVEEKAKNLNSDIINLLIDISSKNLSDYEANKKSEDIKKQISEYSIFVNSAEKDFIERNGFLNQFFSDAFTKEYLLKFNIPMISLDLLEKKKLVQTSNSEYIHENLADNNSLIISEKEKKVFLPYKKAEIEDYLEQYPDKYKSYKDVINNEFIVPLSYYQHFPVIARFREAYSLIRDKEGKSVIEALKYAMDLMLKSELNPAIIAACKYQEQLENYLKCLENNNLDNFTDFYIKFDISLV